MQDWIQQADWKSEKHVPVIDVVKQDDGTVDVTAQVGKEIAHPNTTEHHISWIEVYFKPEGAKFPYQIGRFDFTAHGASAEGPNTSGVLTQPKVIASFKTDKPGTIRALSYCNVHGLWASEADVA